MSTILEIFQCGQVMIMINIINSLSLLVWHIYSASLLIWSDSLLCLLTARVLMERCSVEQRPALVRITHHTLCTIFCFHLPMLSEKGFPIYFYSFSYSAVDCGWSEWTVWSACSRTCDVGIRRRYRSGTNPAPAFGGRACEGERIGLDTCSITPCFGTVTPWQHD